MNRFQGDEAYIVKLVMHHILNRISEKAIKLHGMR